MVFEEIWRLSRESSSVSLLSGYLEQKSQFHSRDNSNYQKVLVYITSSHLFELSNASLSVSTGVWQGFKKRIVREWLDTIITLLDWREFIFLKVVGCWGESPSFYLHQKAFVLSYFPISYIYHSWDCSPFLQLSFLREIIALLYTLIVIYLAEKDLSIYYLLLLFYYHAMVFPNKRQHRVTDFVLVLFGVRQGCAHYCHSETQDEGDFMSSCGMNIARSKMGGDEASTSSKILHSHFIKSKSAVQTWLVGWDSSILLWPEVQVQQKR